MPGIMPAGGGIIPGIIPGIMPGIGAPIIGCGGIIPAGGIIPGIIPGIGGAPIGRCANCGGATGVARGGKANKRVETRAVPGREGYRCKYNKASSARRSEAGERAKPGVAGVVPGAAATGGTAGFTDGVETD